MPRNDEFTRMNREQKQARKRLVDFAQGKRTPAGPDEVLHDISQLTYSFEDAGVAINAAEAMQDLSKQREEQTTRRLYSKTQAPTVASLLASNGRAFSVAIDAATKLACICVQDGQPLPSQLGKNGLGDATYFDKWIESVGMYFEEPLAEATQDKFKLFFLQEMTPAEALKADRARDRV